MTLAEKNYSLDSRKLEFLALKWSVTELFRDYLYYSNDFVVYTHNNPLIYVLSTTKLNATGMRWVSELADFNFKIRSDIGQVGFIEMQKDCPGCQWILRSTWIYALNKPLRSSLKLQ